MMRNILKRALTAAVAALCLLPGLAQAKSYYSIQEVKAQTESLWQQSYQTPWRQVDIDVPIRLPEVSAFPILRVRVLSPVARDKLAGYRHVRRNQDGVFEANIHGDEKVPGDWGIKSSLVFDNEAVPDILPENSSLGFEEARDFIYGEIQRLFGLGPADLVLRQTQVDSSFYRYTRKAGQIIWGSRASDTGRYRFTFQQYFYGIGYQPALNCYDPQNFKLGKEKSIRSGSLSFRITDPAHFRIVSQLMEEVEIIHGDIPLLPFARAREALEGEIMAGRLRGIDSLELCYIPYTDPKDDQVFWLLPAWYARGAYTRDPAQAFSPWRDDQSGEVIDDGVQRAELAFQAQLGSLLDYNDKGKNRRAVPRIITWENVR